MKKKSVLLQITGLLGRWSWFNFQTSFLYINEIIAMSERYSSFILRVKFHNVGLRQSNRSVRGSVKPTSCWDVSSYSKMLFRDDKFDPGLLHILELPFQILYLAFCFLCVLCCCNLLQELTIASVICHILRGKTSLFSFILAIQYVNYYKLASYGAFSYGMSFTFLSPWLTKYILLIETKDKLPLPNRTGFIHHTWVSKSSSVHAR